MWRYDFFLIFLIHINLIKTPLGSIEKDCVISEIIFGTNYDFIIMRLFTVEKNCINNLYYSSHDGNVF